MSERLRAELRQNKPFSSLEQAALLGIARTAAVLDHAVAEGLRPYGVTPTQYNVLRILRGAGAAGLCRAEVRDRMISPVADVTRLLDRLADAGYVARVRDTEDRRYVTARITADGLALLERADGMVQRLQKDLLGHLSQTKLRQLVALLDEARPVPAGV